MHPIGGWPSDPGHRALLPFSKPAATQSLPLASTTRGRHSQTDTNTTPPPSSTSIRAVTPAASTTAADGRPRRARARHRRRAQRVESDVDDRPQPARGTPSSARRPDRLADYMGYCPHRREGHMRCGTRDGRTLSRRRRLDPRLLVVRSRRATTEPWAARNGAKAARGALLSAQSETSERVVEMLVAVRKRGSASPRPAGSGR